MSKIKSNNINSCLAIESLKILIESSQRLVGEVEDQIRAPSGSFMKINGELVPVGGRWIPQNAELYTKSNDNDEQFIRLTTNNEIQHLRQLQKVIENEKKSIENANKNIERKNKQLANENNKLHETSVKLLVAIRDKNQAPTEEDIQTQQEKGRQADKDLKELIEKRNNFQKEIDTISKNKAELNKPILDIEEKLVELDLFREPYIGKAKERLESLNEELIKVNTSIGAGTIKQQIEEAKKTLAEEMTRQKKSNPLFFWEGKEQALNEEEKQAILFFEYILDESLAKISSSTPIHSTEKELKERQEKIMKEIKEKVTFLEDERIDPVITKRLKEKYEAELKEQHNLISLQDKKAQDLNDKALKLEEEIKMNEKRIKEEWAKARNMAKERNKALNLENKLSKQKSNIIQRIEKINETINNINQSIANSEEIIRQKQQEVKETAFHLVVN